MAHTCRGQFRLREREPLVMPLKRRRVWTVTHVPPHALIAVVAETDSQPWDKSLSRRSVLKRGTALVFSAPALAGLPTRPVPPRRSL